MSDSEAAMYIARLKDAVVNCDLDNVESIAKGALNSKVDPLKAIQEGLAKGIREVGDRYGRGEAYLPELVMAANVMRKGGSVLEPYIPKGADRGGLGKVVIGTVEGDIHDIGKTLVGTIMGTAGFDVIDLGVDIQGERFVETAVREKAKIVGMSALMTTTMVRMPEVISSLASKGVRKSMIVLVGGAPTTKEWAKEIGADDQAGAAVEGLAIARNLLGKR